MQVRLEAALDNVIPTLPLPPSKAFAAILNYAIDGLILQGAVSRREDVFAYVSCVLSKRGMIG